MKIKDIPFLLWDSFRSLFMDLIEFMASLKKARTWSFITYATLFLAMYYKNYTLIKIALPIMILLYIIRRKEEPEYNQALRERAFTKNNEHQIREYYDKYKRHCYFSHTKPMSYKRYVALEKIKIDERRYTEQGPVDT